jgi:hypothetical protein
MYLSQAVKADSSGRESEKRERARERQDLKELGAQDMVHKAVVGN